MIKKKKLSLLASTLLLALTSCSFTRIAEKTDVADEPEISFSEEGKQTFGLITRNNSGTDNNGYAYQTYSYSISTGTTPEVSIDINFDEDPVEHDIDDYLIGSVDYINKTFTITCKQAFGAIAIARLYITYNPEAYADITIRYSPKYFVVHNMTTINASYQEKENYSFNDGGLFSSYYYVSDFGFQLRKNVIFYASANTEGVNQMPVLPQVVRTKTWTLVHGFTDTDNIDLSYAPFDPDWSCYDELVAGCKATIQEWINNGLNLTQNNLLYINNFKTKFANLYGLPLAAACEDYLRDSCTNGYFYFKVNLKDVVLDYSNDYDFMTNASMDFNHWITFNIQLFETASPYLSFNSITF